MSNRDLKLVAEFKQKEFERLTDYALNQMSLIEVGLNLFSVGRNPNSLEYVWVPPVKDIDVLCETLKELRSNILTSEEREALK